MSNKRTLRIGIELVTNEAIREYHTNMEVSKSSTENFDLPVPDFHRESLEEVGETARKLIKLLTNVPGILEVWIHRYSVSVTKAPMFDWDEVQDGVVKALKATFGVRKAEVSNLREEEDNTPRMSILELVLAGLENLTDDEETPATTTEEAENATNDTNQTAAESVE